MTMHDSLSTLLEQRFGPGIEVPEQLQDEPALLALASHRSIRRFRPDPVPDDVLQTVLACAFTAPSKSDLQQACVIRIEDAEHRAAIADLIPSMPWIRAAPVLLLFCADNRRIRRICELRGKPFANDHLDSLFNAAVDAGLVLMAFIQAAEAAGLGCCPLSAVRNHSKRIGELLELPAHAVPVAGLVAGYPGEDRSICPRLPTSVTVHTDRYDDTKLEEELDAYDRRRHAQIPLASDRQRDPERYGEAEFYGWSEDKARQVAVRERADFGAFVRDQGFELD